MMPPLFRFLSLRRWRALLGAAALLPAAAGAVELGEVAVHSHLGQQLSADIELVDLTADELADLQARLARPDVFTGASIAMHPALSGMNIAVIKRDKRRLLHLTTLRPIDSELLHIFFEFSGGGRQTVRTATLWLTPDPVPARSAAAGADGGSGRPALPGNAVLAEQGSRAGAPQTAGAQPRAAVSSSAPPQTASLAAPQPAAARGAALQAAPPAGAQQGASPATTKPTAPPAALPAMTKPTAQQGASPAMTKPTAPSAAQQQAAAPLAAQQVASVRPVSAAARLSSTPPGSASAPAAEAGATPSDAELSAALARATARRAAHAMPASPATPAGTRAAGQEALAPALALPASVAAGKRGKPAAGPSCSPDQLDQRLKQCVALDAQNAAIASKLKDLEGKVKVLQSALAPVAAGQAAQGAAAAKVAQGAAAKVEQGAAAKAEHSPSAGPDAAAAKAAHGASASGLASDKAGPPASATASAPSAAKDGHAASSAPAPSASASASAKDKLEHAAAATGEQAASAGHAVAAKGAPAASDAHASASAAASASSAPAAASAKASAASAAARASKPAAPEKPKQMTRSRLMTLIAGGTLALLAVIATIVHFVRKRRAKLAAGPLKIWQSWRKKKPEDAAPAKTEPKAEELPPEPVLTDIVEHGTA